MSSKFQIMGLFILGVAVGIVGTAFALSGSNSKKPSVIYSPISQRKDLSEKIALASLSTPDSGELEKAIYAALEGSKGKYSIVVKSLSGRRTDTFVLNEHARFEAASLYKLWVMIAAFEKITSGQLLSDQKLSADIPDLNKAFNLDSETAELTEGTISMTVKQALEQMISISHNYAALLLTRKIGMSSLKKLLVNYNLNESSVGSSPKTTASDIAFLLEKLYLGQVVNPSSSEEMMGLLKKQKIDRKLPLYLPNETVIAHKTGELGRVSHDAGIVFSPRGDYIIVVLSESGSPAGAEERIARISEAVYKYFNP